MQQKCESIKDKRNSNLENKPIPPAIILCCPQMGENIGSAARAMLNFGITDLRIIAPRDGWPNERAIATASGAFDIIPEPHIFKTLKDAIEDLHFTVATTARRRDMVKPVYEPYTAIQELHKYKKTGIVFGAERSGLTNEDLSLCQAILTFPTNQDFTSLNLAQSVLLVAYEWKKATEQHIERQEETLPVPLKELNMFLTRLERDLEDQRFFRTPDMKPTMLINIRNIFTRNNITKQELSTLHGVLSALRGNKIKKQ